ncbi:MAG: MFS transporter [Sphingobium sp.]|uniref:MFS transporter n=1 Tax=Sphingobium sp. TaxID=1912891 RepID=UPI0029B1F681|nr:MFS transporter [Sphingobium sp.]MDX3910859.1 MFS transporter [Sphingobium sp.]
MASNFGGLIQSVGASWMMTSLTKSPALVALVQSSTTLPIMLLSLLAGAIADNLDRRIVMLWSQAFMLSVSLALSFCAWTGVLTPTLLLGFTFLIGCGTAFNGPAWQSSVGEMVPRTALPAAVALNSMGFNIARSIGPALGGAIVAAAGAAAAFAINAASYLALIGVLLRWRPERPARTLPPEPIGTAMGAGVRYVAMSPNLRVVLVRATVFGFAASAIPALMPIIAKDQVAGGPLTYGLLLGAFGVGAVLGALSSGRLRARFSTEWIVRLAATAITMGAAVSAVSTIMPVTVVALVLAGAGWVLALSTFNVTVQMAAPRWVVGRAIALYQMGAFGGMALGSWLFGELADGHGVSVALAVAAAVQALSVPLGVLLPLPQAEALNLDPQNRWQEPQTAVQIEPRSGPVVVTVEYRILPSDIGRFLTVMSERRRIRVRDGARHWTLLRDLGDENLWIERYNVSTWLDYIRHNQRRTNADAENSDRIRALHQGPEGPRVHRMIERQTSLFLPHREDPLSTGADPLTDPTRSS